MKANKEFKDDVVICKNCGEQFHPRYSSRGIYCSISCKHEYLSRIKYEEYLDNPLKYYGKLNIKWVKPHILDEQ